MEGPLAELRNQRLPRRKMAQTYGKKKGGALKPLGTEAIHRDIFGTDDVDDVDDVENKLASLSLKVGSEVVVSEPRIADIPTTPPPAPPLSTAKVRSVSKPKTTKTEIGTNIGAAVSRTARSRSRPVSAKSRSELISQEDHDTIAPLLDLSQHEIETFSTFGDKLNKSYDIAKIGEGSFAEVFKVSAITTVDNTDTIDTTESSASNPSTKPSGAIIKVIPLTHPTSLASNPNVLDRTSSVTSVVRELKILQTLDSVHGFTRFRGIRVVSGRWPTSFLSAFRHFQKTQGKRALNGAPDEDFDASQVYVLVEMDDAGTEVAEITRPNAFEVFDVFWQTAVLLANAEEVVEFEHRDLHLSNICVKPRAGGSVDVTKIRRMDTLMGEEEEGKESLLGLSNLKLTVIDYTVSRCVLSDGDVAYDPMTFLSSCPGTEECDETEGEDHESALQFQTYRKTKVLAKRRHQLGDREEECDKWSASIPQTNVLWLTYLLHVLKRRSQGRLKPGKWYVVKGSGKESKSLQEEIWRRLDCVLKFIDGVASGGDGEGENNNKEAWERESLVLPQSSREFLHVAVENGWLTAHEIQSFRSRLERDES